MTLSQNDLMIIGKYFDTINDFINLAKTCKNNRLFEFYHFNPIPLDNNTIKLFSNVETYHKYNNMFSNTHNLKSIIDWITPVNYDERNNDNNIIYKCLYYKPDKNLTNIKISNNINVLIDKNFEDYTNLKNIIISPNVTTIGKKCFYNCKNLGGGADLGSKNISKINIPTSVTKIGKYCFWNCLKLEHMTIPTSVKEIGKECFAWCNKLSNIDIPTSVTKISYGCFMCCKNLTDIITNKCYKT